MEASKTYRQFKCPKCLSEFEDPDPNNEFKNGLLCSACPGGLRGVIYPKTRKHMITQEEWDALNEEMLSLRKALVEIVEWRLPMVQDIQTGQWHTYDYMYGARGEQQYIQNIAKTALRSEYEKKIILGNS